MKLVAGQCQFCISSHLVYVTKFDNKNLFKKLLPILFKRHEYDDNALQNYKDSIEICPVCIYNINFIRSVKSILLSTSPITSGCCVVCNTDDDLFTFEEVWESFCCKLKCYRAIQGKISLCTRCFHVVNLTDYFRNKILNLCPKLKVSSVKSVKNEDDKHLRKSSIEGTSLSRKNTGEEDLIHENNSTKSIVKKDSAAVRRKSVEKDTIEAERNSKISVNGAEENLKSSNKDDLKNKKTPTKSLKDEVKSSVEVDLVGNEEKKLRKSAKISLDFNNLKNSSLDKSDKNDTGDDSNKSLDEESSKKSRKSAKKSLDYDNSKNSSLDKNDKNDVGDDFNKSIDEESSKKSQKSARKSLDYNNSSLDKSFNKNDIGDDSIKSLDEESSKKSKGKKKKSSKEDGIVSDDEDSFKTPLKTTIKISKIDNAKRQYSIQESSLSEKTQNSLEVVPSTNLKSILSPKESPKPDRPKKKVSFGHHVETSKENVKSSTEIKETASKPKLRARSIEGTLTTETLKSSPSTKKDLLVTKDKVKISNILQMKKNLKRLETYSLDFPNQVKDDLKFYNQVPVVEIAKIDLGSLVKSGFPNPKSIFDNLFIKKFPSPPTAARKAKPKSKSSKLKVKINIPSKFANKSISKRDARQKSKKKDHEFVDVKVKLQRIDVKKIQERLDSTDEKMVVDDFDDEEQSSKKGESVEAMNVDVTGDESRKDESVRGEEKIEGMDSEGDDLKKLRNKNYSGNEERKSNRKSRDKSDDDKAKKGNGGETVKHDAAKEKGTNNTVDDHKDAKKDDELNDENADQIENADESNKDKETKTKKVEVVENDKAEKVNEDEKTSDKEVEEDASDKEVKEGTDKLVDEEGCNKPNRADVDDTVEEKEDELDSSAFGDSTEDEDVAKDRNGLDSNKLDEETGAEDKSDDGRKSENSLTDEKKSGTSQDFGTLIDEVQECLSHTGKSGSKNDEVLHLDESDIIPELNSSPEYIGDDDDVDVDVSQSIAVIESDLEDEEIETKNNVVGGRENKGRKRRMMDDLSSKAKKVRFNETVEAFELSD